MQLAQDNSSRIYAKIILPRFLVCWVGAGMSKRLWKITPELRAEMFLLTSAKELITFATGRLFCPVRNWSTGMKANFYPDGVLVTKFEQIRY